MEEGGRAHSHSHPADCWAGQAIAWDGRVIASADKPVWRTHQFTQPCTTHLLPCTSSQAFARGDFPGSVFAAQGALKEARRERRRHELLVQQQKFYRSGDGQEDKALAVETMAMQPDKLEDFERTGWVRVKSRSLDALCNSVSISLFLSLSLLPLPLCCCACLCSYVVLLPVSLTSSVFCVVLFMKCGALAF